MHSHKDRKKIFRISRFPFMLMLMPMFMNVIMRIFRKKVLTFFLMIVMAMRYNLVQEQQRK
ncbi:hypothetical protein [Salinimicrobium oceani]|uniref:Uncharacterized protein n=1 Tax=Salinimicrobium oceani TaxID=2722702 RepID=A0ABX1CYF2_9FLAO|nr:hypothetical protein [Salinimicrobium oceani]NJW53290.1 hypothetical protein [Salinimicrobium oceani]